MPARPKRFTRCGHVGKGKYCHRCDQADELEKTAGILGEPEGDEENRKFVEKLHAELTAKVTHLRGPSRRQFNRTRASS